MSEDNMGRTVDPGANGGGNQRSVGTSNSAAIFGLATMVLGALRGTSEIATKIDEAANLAVTTINGAKDTATSEVETAKGDIDGSVSSAEEAATLAANSAQAAANSAIAAAASARTPTSPRPGEGLLSDDDYGY